MSDGLIGGVIGDEDESSEAESGARAGADAFAHLGEAQRGASCGCEEGPCMKEVMAP